MRSLLVLAALLAIPFVIGTAVGLSPESGDEVFAFQDPAIVESSGLVALGDGHFVTTNDSGDTGRLFTVDDNGETVGVTTWSSTPDDVEALAPAADGEVWAGDIGDNPAERAEISVSRVPVGPGDRDADVLTYPLTYPDGPHDAEALLAHPVTGRLYIVSKVVFGGKVYEAPERLAAGSDNRLRAMADVTGLVTDGAFFPDGRHLVLRTYTKALVYSFPDLSLVGEIDLPGQRQGEGIAVLDDESLFLSSEGVNAPLLRVDVPDEIREAMAAPHEPEASASASVQASDTASATASPSASTPAATEAPRQEAGPDVTSWLIGIGVMALLVITLLRALRPR
jgi:hypothetical protein